MAISESLTPHEYLSQLEKSLETQTTELMKLKLSSETDINALKSKVEALESANPIGE